MTIKDDLKYFKEIYNDFGKITDSVLARTKVNYLDNIKELPLAQKKISNYLKTLLNFIVMMLF